MYIIWLILHKVASHECSEPHICTLAIISGSGYFLCKYGIHFNYFKSNISDIHPWYVPSTYYIVCLGKQLLKLFIFLSIIQSISFLMSRFTRLNWSSKSTITIDVVNIRSFGHTLHLLSSFILSGVV